MQTSQLCLHGKLYIYELKCEDDRIAKLISIGQII